MDRYTFHFTEITQHAKQEVRAPQRSYKLPPLPLFQHHNHVQQPPTCIIFSLVGQEKTASPRKKQLANQLRVAVDNSNWLDFRVLSANKSSNLYQVVRHQAATKPSSLTSVQQLHAHRWHASPRVNPWLNN